MKDCRKCNKCQHGLIDKVQTKNYGRPGAYRICTKLNKIVYGRYLVCFGKYFEPK